MIVGLPARFRDDLKAAVQPMLERPLPSGGLPCIQTVYFIIAHRLIRGNFRQIAIIEAVAGIPCRFACLRGGGTLL